MSEPQSRTVAPGTTARISRDLELPADAPPGVAALLHGDAVDVERVFLDDEHGWLVEITGANPTPDASTMHTLVVGLDAVETMTPEPEWWPSR